jgi:adenylate cyclase
MLSLKPAPRNLRNREMQTALARAQHQRQVLIFAIQCLFALNITLVYQSTTQLALRDMFKSQTALLIGSYLFVSVWGLYRSHAHKQRWVDVAIATIMDFALCMEVMFTQYETALAIDGELATAPLFSYVYLFIAIRCLHLRAAYVYFAGALASLSWAVLVAVNVVGSLDGLSIQAALLTGVIDKLLSIVATTATLAVCVQEARKYFEASIIRAIAGKGLARFVNEAVAAEVLFSEEVLQPGQGRLQTVAILMMDIRGFTSMAFNSDPSESMALLQEYQRLMEAVIVQHGGCIDKFMGDGILAHFGAVKSHPRYAAEALRCVEHLIHTTETWNEKRIAAGLRPLEFGVACAVGEAIVGLVGGTSKVEYTIIGDPVNVTAKLEKHTKTLKARAVTTARAFEIAQRQGFAPIYPRRLVKAAKLSGVDQPVDLVVLCDRLMVPAAAATAAPLAG